MPSWISHAPWTLPFQRLIFELGLRKPQYKIIPVLLVGIFLHIVPDSHQKLLFTLGGKDIIILQSGSVKINVASGHVGIAFFQQHFHHMNKLGNAVCGRFHHIRSLDIQLLAVGKESIRIKLCNLHHGLVLTLCPLQHLIFTGIRIRGKMPHICDIHDTLHIIPCIAQCFLQNVLHNIAPQIPDMRIMVHRRSTGIHGHFSILVWDKKLHLSAQRIIKPHFVLHFASSSFICLRCFRFHVSVQKYFSAVAPVPGYGLSSLNWLSVN